MRSSIIVAFATLGLSTSVSAQEIDQNTRQQIERIAAAYVENWNKHDAAGVAGLYAKDGVLVTATGAVRSGPQEIEQAYQSALKMFPQHNGQTIEQISPLGNDADIRIGQFHLSGQGQNGPTKLDGALHCGRCARRGDMENPPSNGCSDPAARRGCEVGVAAVEPRCECRQRVGLSRWLGGRELSFSARSSRPDP